MNIITPTLVVLALYGISSIHSACPNPNFINHHVCNTCKTPADAAAWAKENIRYYKRNRAHTDWTIFQMPEDQPFAEEDFTETQYVVRYAQGSGKPHKNKDGSIKYYEELVTTETCRAENNLAFDCTPQKVNADGVPEYFTCKVLGQQCTSYHERGDQSGHLHYKYTKCQ